MNVSSKPLKKKNLSSQTVDLLPSKAAIAAFLLADNLGKDVCNPRCHDNSRGWGRETGENKAWKPGWIEKPEAMETRYRPHLTDCH